MVKFAVMQSPEVEVVWTHCSNQVVESLLNKILERWKKPVALLPSTEAEEEARQASREANKASLLHQLDLMCRRHLSETMQQLTSSKVNV